MRPGDRDTAASGATLSVTKILKGGSNSRQKRAGRVAELEHVIKRVLEGAIMTSMYPKTQITQIARASHVARKNAKILTASETRAALSRALLSTRNSSLEFPDTSIWVRSIDPTHSSTCLCRLSRTLSIVLARHSSTTTLKNQREFQIAKQARAACPR